MSKKLREIGVFLVIFACASDIPLRGVLFSALPKVIFLALREEAVREESAVDRTEWCEDKRYATPRNMLFLGDPGSKKGRRVCSFIERGEWCY